MKQLLCLLAVLCGAISAANAGPNEGGVLWVHDTGIVFSGVVTLPPVSTAPVGCAGVDNQQDADGVDRIWKVYAAFPLGSQPRLKTVGWATQFPEAATSASSYVHVSGGGTPDEDGPGTDFFIGDLGFPTASGGQLGQSFPFGPRTTSVVELFYFYGFGYHASGPLPIWSTAPHSAPGNRVFGDDANPTNEDPIMGYSSLGFGRAGLTRCPSVLLLVVCCFDGGSCQLLTPASCTAAGGVTSYEDACAPNPCPQPVACCFVSGACSMLLQAACASAGGVFQDGACDPNPCPQPGACCSPDGFCSILPPAACAPAGGSFLGGACLPNPCPQPPPGACCPAWGGCWMATPVACANSGGSFYGGSCTPNPCPPPAGYGDTIAGPLIVTIPLPFHDSGTTVYFDNDYDEVCPYSGSQAPDVVYAFASNGTYSSISIGLCNSSYDTKLFVYQDGWTPGSPWACNDDFCFDYTSAISQMPVPAGHIYYIVVDGWDSASGAYELDVYGELDLPFGACCALNGACFITQAAACDGTWHGENSSCVPSPCPPPVPVPCPDGSLIEGEPACQDDYVDAYNGGCNVTPEVWQTVAPQANGCFTLCGKSCTLTLDGGSNRDSDWFYSALASGTVTATVTAEFPVMIALFYGTDCANLQYVYSVGADHTPTSVSYAMGECVAVGFFVANEGFSGFSNELGYVLTVCGLDCTPPPQSGACCNAAGLCLMLATPDLCASLGGTWMGEGAPCVPTPCAAVPSGAPSWGAIKARFLQPAARREGVHGQSVSAGPAGTTPKPVVTPRAPGSTVPALLSATRPPKPRSASLRSGK